MQRLVPVLLVAVALAGCTTPSETARSDEVDLSTCEPGDGEDPYPDDEIFTVRDAGVDARNETLTIAACLVNGQDTDHVEHCGSAAGPIRVNVTSADGEEVFARPYTDAVFTLECRTWTLPANAEWDPARFNVTWDLRKDVCEDDANCSHEGEGERVPGGGYTVRIRYPQFVEPWNRTVRLPPPR